MTDLRFQEVPVTSSSPEYKSTAPSWLFGFIGAFFQVRNAKKRGLTDTGRYWKAAAISTIAGFVATIALLAAMIAMLSSIGSSIATPVTDTSIASTEPSIVPSPTPVDLSTNVQAALPPAQGSDAQSMLRQMFQTRWKAACEGNLYLLKASVSEESPAFKELYSQFRSAGPECTYVPNPANLVILGAGFVGQNRETIEAMYNLEVSGKVYEEHHSILQRQGDHYVYLKEVTS